MIEIIVFISVNIAGWGTRSSRDARNLYYIEVTGHVGGRGQRVVEYET